MSHADAFRRVMESKQWPLALEFDEFLAALFPEGCPGFVRDDMNRAFHAGAMIVMTASAPELKMIALEIGDFFEGLKPKGA